MPRNNIWNAKKNGPIIQSDSPKTSFNNANKIQPDVPCLKRITIRAEPSKDYDNLLSATDSNKDGQTLFSRGRSASRTGNSNGNAIRKARGRSDNKRPNFNLEVPSNGYAWWYVDGISHDGERAISIIGFIGSVFSPWYSWAGRKNPHNHCCINLALYGKGWRWTMTERGEKALFQTQDELVIGPSSFSWENNKLIIRIDEIATPHLDRIKGTVIIEPKAITDVEVCLTTDGAHIWRPFAPNAEVKVNIEKSGWKWNGHGYFDGNFGTRALEQDFSYWTWARFPIGNGSIALYDAVVRNGPPLSVALNFQQNGTVKKIIPPPESTLPRSLWAVKRKTRSDKGYKPKQIKHMLDAPFYTRSAIKTKVNSKEVIGVHEALDLNRFASPILKPMLALRVPRSSRWKPR